MARAASAFTMSSAALLAVLIAATPAPDSAPSAAPTEVDRLTPARSALAGAAGGLVGGLASATLFGAAWLASRDQPAYLTQADVLDSGGAAVASTAVIAFFAGASVDTFAKRSTEADWLALTGCVAGGVLALVLAPIAIVCVVVSTPLLLLQGASSSCANVATSDARRAEPADELDDADVVRLAVPGVAGVLSAAGMAVGAFVGAEAATQKSAVREHAILGAAVGAIIGGTIGGAVGGSFAR